MGITSLETPSLKYRGVPACETLPGQTLHCLRTRPDLSSQQWWGAEPGNTEAEIRTQPLPWVFQLRAPRRTPQGPARCVRRGTRENPDTQQARSGVWQIREVRALHKPANAEDRDASDSSCLSGTGSGAGLSKNTFLPWEAAALSPLPASGN